MENQANDQGLALAAHSGWHYIIAGRRAMGGALPHGLRIYNALSQSRHLSTPQTTL
jgi:hypothetical protein